MVKHELRVKRLKVRVEIQKCEWNPRVQVHELGTQLYELRVQIHEIRAQIHWFN